MKNRMANIVIPLMLTCATLFLVWGVGLLTQEEKVTASEISAVQAYVPEIESIGEFTLTAYCSCERCCGRWAVNRPKDANGQPIVYTASGAVAQQGKTIAVDTDVIPYGTIVIINGNAYTAQDTMAQKIKEKYDGKIIDVYFDNHDEALEFGKQKSEIFILKG